MASRIAARSTTHGTPVKSCSSTRLVRNAISFSTFAFTSHRASASTSARFTNASSSFRSRFSSRILRLNGSRSHRAAGERATLPRRKMVYCRPATFSVARLPKVFGCVMGRLSLCARTVSEGGREGSRSHCRTARGVRDRLSAIYNVSVVVGSGVTARCRVTRRGSAELAARRERSRFGLVPRAAAWRTAHAQLAFVDETKRHEHVEHEEARERCDHRRRVARAPRRSPESRRAPRRASAARGAGSRARACAAGRSPFRRSRSRPRCPRYAARTILRTAADSSLTEGATLASEAPARRSRASLANRRVGATHRSSPTRVALRSSPTGAP